VHACVRACERACVRACVHVSGCACVFACARVNACVREQLERACVRVRVHECDPPMVCKSRHRVADTGSSSVLSPARAVRASLFTHDPLPKHCTLPSAQGTPPSDPMPGPRRCCCWPEELVSTMSGRTECMLRGSHQRAFGTSPFTDLIQLECHTSGGVEHQVGAYAGGPAYVPQANTRAHPDTSAQAWVHASTRDCRHSLAGMCACKGACMPSHAHARLHASTDVCKHTCMGLPCICYTHKHAHAHARRRAHTDAGPAVR